MSVNSNHEPALPAAGSEQVDQLALAEVLLDAALQAERAGNLGELVREYPLATRWMVRRHWRVVCGTLGLLAGPPALPLVASLLLRWLCTRLRPDAQPGFEGIADEAWLRLSSWRPMLAMATHLGFIRVPDFPHQYRRRQDEPPLDNLCGLWDVGPSTVYRAMERARQAMAGMLIVPSLDATHKLTLREMAFAAVDPAKAVVNVGDYRPTHVHLAGFALAAGDSVSELWHCWKSADSPRFIQVLRQRAGDLSFEPETDALVERVASSGLGAREQVDLWIARAAMARARNTPERELAAYGQALQVAQAIRSPLLLGIVQSALGKFYELRDVDRAFACYQDSAEFLRDLGPFSGDTEALEHFMTTFVRLAWLYLLRNDPRAKVVLDRAEELRATARASDEVLGTLEQCWGQYWRRAGDPSRSLEHRFRALNIFERLADRRSVLSTCQNIAFDLAERGEYERATRFSRRVLDAASKGGVEPEVIVGARFNLGAIAFWKKDYDTAIAEYQAAVDEAELGQLRMPIFRARYNLAEAYYWRFRELGRPEDEASGDAQVRAVLGTAGSEGARNVIESARTLKQQVLGESKPVAALTRLLLSEEAVHFDEMDEIHRHREVLAVPGEPMQHAQSHLAIARAYLAISTKEREAALALIHKHGLQAQFTAEFEELKQTFQRELTREQHLADAWKQAAADVVDDARRAPLIAHIVREGSINKSGYVALCGVSPATASKHLGLLAERGLLVQTGKGPSTRYALPG